MAYREINENRANILETFALKHIFLIVKFHKKEGKILWHKLQHPKRKKITKFLIFN